MARAVLFGTYGATYELLSRYVHKIRTNTIVTHARGGEEPLPLFTRTECLEAAEWRR